MRSKFLHGLKLALSLALIGGIVLHLHTQRERLSQLLDLSIPWMMALFMAHLLNYVLLGKAQAIGLATLGVRLSKKEWFGLSVIAELFNYVLPAKGGTAVRFMYLNQKHGTKLVDFMVMMTTFTFMALSVLGLIGLLFNLTIGSNGDRLILIINGLLLLLLASAPVFVYGFDLVNRWTKFQTERRPLDFIREKGPLLRALALYSAIFLLYPFKTAFSFYVVGLDIPMQEMLEISLILLVVSLFPVLPGNLGIKELATAYLAQRYGLGFEEALLASIVDRTVLSILIIPTGLISYGELFWQGDLLSRKRGPERLRESLVGNG